MLMAQEAGSEEVGLDESIMVEVTAREVDEAEAETGETEQMSMQITTAFDIRIRHAHQHPPYLHLLVLAGEAALVVA